MSETKENTMPRETPRVNAHSPLPWHWSDEYTTVDGLDTWTLVAGDGSGILCCDGFDNSPQCLGREGAANVPLIATAPEMLAALYEIQDLADYASTGKAIKEIATIAITKATTTV